MKNNKLKMSRFMTAYMAGMTTAVLKQITLQAVDIESATNTIWSETLSNVKPLITNIVLPAAILVVVIMLIGLAIRSYRDYKQTGEVNWGLIVVLFIVLGILIVFRSTDLLWNLVDAGDT